MWMTHARCVALATLRDYLHKPVDTLQFRLLDLGMSTAEVHRRLDPPAPIATETRTVLVPLRGRTGRQRHTHDAPPYIVRTTEVERWYYPEGGGSTAMVPEFRNGELWSKDKYR